MIVRGEEERHFAGYPVIFYLPDEEVINVSNVGSRRMILAIET